MAAEGLFQTKQWTKYKMNRITVKFRITMIILASLPYSSAVSLPNGDPAPGRSPGPPTEGPSYEETANFGVEETTVSATSVDMDDVCVFARVASDSGDVVTLSEDDSDVNLTFSHSVFEVEELVRGVVYDGKFSIS